MDEAQQEQIEQPVESPPQAQDWRSKTGGIITYLPAHTGTHVIMWDDDDFRKWSADRVTKIPVISWELHANGLTRPITPNPSLNNHPFHIVQFPNGFVHYLDAQLMSFRMEKNLKDFCTVVKKDQQQRAERTMLVGGVAGNA